MPVLPNALYAKYTEQLGLSDYDAGVITADKDVAMYFEALIAKTENYKSAVNWLMGAVKSYLNDSGVAIGDFTLKPEILAGLIHLVDSARLIIPWLRKNCSPGL